MNTLLTFLALTASAQASVKLNDYSTASYIPIVDDDVVIWAGPDT